MNNETLLDAIGMIDEEAVRDAGAYRRPKKVMPAIKWLAAAAVVMLCFMISVPVIAGGAIPFYDILYTVSPRTAQYFKPVQMSCEDEGIRMEVVATYIHENTAEIYISMQDLEGGRIDETTDLFDSCSINTPYNSIGHCEKVSYDSETATVTFLITISHMGEQAVEGDKITFSVGQFISQKEEFDAVIPDIDLTSAEKVAAVQSVKPRGKSFIGEPEDEDIADVALQTNGVLCTPIAGVHVTGMGYVDDLLHIQVCYGNIMETDNHGWLFLKNKETGEENGGIGSISFLAEDGSGYQDYIFDNVRFEDLGNYELYGMFVTSGNRTEGDWSVTFPLVK